MIGEIVVATVVPMSAVVMSNIAEGGISVSNLLTGGGFVFLAAVMGGLFLMNKNAADGAKSIAEGAREYVDGARAELTAGREELAEGREVVRKANMDLELERRKSADARRDMRHAHEALEDAQHSIRSGQMERAKLRAWITEQCEANARHKVWDDELVAMLEANGLTIRPAPGLSVKPPASVADAT